MHGRFSDCRSKKRLRSGENLLAGSRTTNSTRSTSITSDIRMVWRVSVRTILRRGEQVLHTRIHLLTRNGSCQQILSPGPLDHGCPYRHYSPENLQTALLSSYSSRGLTSADLPEIMATVKAGHYHVACTRVFEITHSVFGVKKGDGVGSGESVTHPNQYAARSMELHKAQQNGDAMVVTT
jgi:hypothetical protein